MSKSSASLPEDEGGHPLLVTGSFGNGRTLAYMSDVGPHWSPTLSANGRVSAIMAQYARLADAQLSDGRRSNGPTAGEADLGVAVIQMEPRIGETKANVEKTVRLIRQAHKSGAELIVLPELCNTGYVFESRAEATALAEEIPDGETCRAWQEIAAALNIHLVAGITERDGVKLYNSAVVIGPGGLIGRYRKNHLWADEALVLHARRFGFPGLRHAGGPDRLPHLL